MWKSQKNLIRFYLNHHWSRFLSRIRRFRYYHHQSQIRRIMLIILQRMYAPCRKSIERLRNVQKPSQRSRFSWRIHQNPQNPINDLRFLQRKRTQSIHQPWWSCSLRSRRTSRHLNQLWRRSHLRCFIIRCCPLIHGNRNRWRSNDQINWKKHHHPRQKILNLHHLRR